MGTLNARTSLVDVNGSTFEVLAVHTRDGRCGLFFRGHLDKAEASRFTAELVRYDIGACDLAECLKSLTYIVAGNVRGQIAYINVHYNLLSRKISYTGRPVFISLFINTIL
jgi:hypothetical protein